MGEDEASGAGFLYQRVCSSLSISQSHPVSSFYLFIYFSYFSLKFIFNENETILLNISEFDYWILKLNFKYYTLKKK